MNTFISRLVLVLAVVSVGTAAAQTPAEVRGGWIAEVGGVRHIYIFKIVDGRVTGIHCTDCYDPDNLAFIRNGSFENGEVEFTVLHDRGEDAPYRRTVRGSYTDGRLSITSRREGADDTVELELKRATPHPPAPPRPPDPPYEPLGPPELLTHAKVSGLWLARTGPRRQNFMFRQVGDEMLGMVCGPCDNPHNMAPIDNISIDGTNFRFEIVHEDAPTGGLAKPFANICNATIAKNELRLAAVRSDAPPGTEPFEMTLVGPIRY